MARGLRLATHGREWHGHGYGYGRGVQRFPSDTEVHVKWWINTWVFFLHCMKL